MVKLITMTILSALILTGCGKSVPPTFTRAEYWDVLADGAVIDRKADELLTLVPSESVVGYQAEFLASNDASKNTVIVRYDIGLTGGPGYIGILSGDRQRWLDNVRIRPDQLKKGEITAATDGGPVSVIIQTDDTTVPGTVFTVNDVSVAYK